jgi:hypothetical protein
MPFGFRRPSWRKSFAARTSVRRIVRNSLGLRAPRGWGWVTNPRRAFYNRIYYRTTRSYCGLTVLIMLELCAIGMERLMK